MSRGVDRARSLCRQQRHLTLRLHVASCFFVCSIESDTAGSSILAAERAATKQTNCPALQRLRFRHCGLLLRLRHRLLHLHHDPVHPGNWARHRRRHHQSPPLHQLFRPHRCPHQES